MVVAADLIREWNDTRRHRCYMSQWWWCYELEVREITPHHNLDEYCQYRGTGEPAAGLRLSPFSRQVIHFCYIVFPVKCVCLVCSVMKLLPDHHHKDGKRMMWSFILKTSTFFLFSWFTRQTSSTRQPSSSPVLLPSSSTSSPCISISSYGITVDVRLIPPLFNLLLPSSPFSSPANFLMMWWSLHEKLSPSWFGENGFAIHIQPSSLPPSMFKASVASVTRFHHNIINPCEMRDFLS